MLYLIVLFRRGPDWLWFSLVSLEETRLVVGLGHFDGLFYGSKFYHLTFVSCVRRLYLHRFRCCPVVLQLAFRRDA